MGSNSSRLECDQDGEKEDAEMSSAALSMMEEAMDISVVLNKIIENLHFTDLTTCRLVSHRWKQISSKLLQNSQSCWVSIVWNDVEKIFRKSESSSSSSSAIHHFHSKVPEHRKLKGLNKILQHPMANFPCCSFAFFGGNLGDPEPQQFFQNFGMKIRHLHLQASPQTFGGGEIEETSQNIFKKILLSEAPYVESLKIQNFSYDWPTHQASLFLPSLKILICEDSTVANNTVLTAYEILRAAPYLKTARIFQNEYTKRHLAPPHGHGHDVDDNYWINPFESSPDEDLLMLTTFKNTGLQLRKFRSLLLRRKYDNHDQRPMRMKMVLDFWGDCLEELILQENCFVLKRKVPFSKPGKMNSIFGAFLLLKSCPNLRFLDCTRMTGMVNDLNGLSTNFEQNDDGMVFPELRFVEKIKIRSNCAKIWMEKLTEMCPNFKKLVLIFDENISTCFINTFQLWGNSLEVINLRIGGGKRKFVCLDPIFTGFSERTCIDLLIVGSSCSFSQEQIDGWRVGLSICELKKLKFLKISFDPGSGHELHLQRRMNNLCDFQLNPILTCISARYAFAKIPSLRVVVEFDHKSPYVDDIIWAFETLIPYVNLRHQCA